MSKQQVKFGEWIEGGFNLYKANFGTLVLGSVFVVVISTVTAGILAGPMLAGLIARMTVLPLGGLAEAPLADRLIAMGLAFAVFFAWRRKVLPGVAAGVVAFILLAAARQAGLLGG